jgi:hypothetical protein
MQGRSLLAGAAVAAAEDGTERPDDEEIVRARLSGLGYIA